MDTPFKGARYYDVDNGSKAVILLHAYTGSPMDVNMVARLIQRKGYVVFCPLFEGHGTKDIFDIFEGNPTIWQEQTHEWVSWMQDKNFESLYIFGLSMGGIFATWALSQNQYNLAGGGVFNSPVIVKIPIDISESFLQYASVIYKSNNLGSFEKVEQQIANLHHQQMNELEAFKRTLNTHLSDIHTPFFIAQSEKDELIDNQGAYLLKEALINAEITFKWYPNNTHVITVNKNREQFEEDLLKFIN